MRFSQWLSVDGLFFAIINLKNLTQNEKKKKDDLKLFKIKLSQIELKSF